MFDKITIALDDRYYKGETLVIETKKQQSDHKYIQSATWNGQPVQNNWMYRDDLMKGGTIVFELGKAPNKSWGVGAVPPSMSNEK